MMQQRIFTLPFFALACLAAGCGNEPAAPAVEPAKSESFYAEIKMVNDHNGKLSATFDRIEFLTGDAATAASRKAGEGIPDVDAKGDTTWSTANDYYILNPDSTLQTLEIATDASVQLIDTQHGGGSGPMPAKTSDLPGHEQLQFFPFELTTRNGKIVAVRAQFVP